VEISTTADSRSSVNSSYRLIMCKILRVLLVNNDIRSMLIINR
jgi:hypothetical protein